MNTDNTAAAYARRCILDLGQSAHDSERVAIWCYDNPPIKPIETTGGERTRAIYISQKALACLVTIAKSIGGEMVKVDAVADSLLCRAVKDMAPNAWAMYERHEQESRALLDELRRNEPADEREERLSATREKVIAQLNNEP